MSRVSNPLAAPVVHCDATVVTDEHGSNPCGTRLISSTAQCPNIANHWMSPAERMASAPFVVALTDTPARYADVIVDDIIAFGSLKSEWVIREKTNEMWLRVEPGSTGECGGGGVS